MSSSYTLSVPRAHAGALQFLVKKHNLRFTHASNFTNSFYCTISSEDIHAFNNFHRDWDQLERELKGEVPEKRKGFWDHVKEFFGG